MTRKSLSDILSAGNGDDFINLWNSTEPADEFGPLPPGVYVCHLVKAELNRSRRKGTPSYNMTFKVIEGDYAGRLVWHDIWLTAKALSMARRDLGRLGVTDPRQLEQPIPKWVRFRISVVVRRDDDGIERNVVRAFEVLGIDQPPVNPFAPETEG
jgi:hypothetical protein